jgi:acetamidase/formamidase
MMNRRDPVWNTKAPDRLICLAGRGNMFDSIKLATEDMVALLVRLHGVSEADAYVFCTTVESVRISACVSNAQHMEGRAQVGLSVPTNAGCAAQTGWDASWTRNVLL